MTECLFPPFLFFLHFFDWVSHTWIHASRTPSKALTTFEKIMKPSIFFNSLPDKAIMYCTYYIMNESITNIHVRSKREATKYLLLKSNSKFHLLLLVENKFMFQYCLARSIAIFSFLSSFLKRPKTTKRSNQKISSDEYTQFGVKEFWRQGGLFIQVHIVIVTTG